MIPQRNISLSSNRLADDGSHRIPEAVLERDYCLAWFLATLSGSPLKAILAFKGGTALQRCYLDDYRVIGIDEDLSFYEESGEGPNVAKVREAFKKEVMKI